MRRRWASNLRRQPSTMTTSCRCPQPRARPSRIWKNRIVGDSLEMFRHLPWPFRDNRFPLDLGATVQRTVLDGEMPALLVVHTVGGDWAIGDGTNDPNIPGASVATHIWHAIDRNSSITGLAHLAPGQQARRLSPHHEWVVSAEEAVD